ncbi:MAG: winged helix-turn-helix transcriptional regulator [Bacteroidales bacterium]|nr:winged helix-turn-helix transcriptional regulator [Bacteroidales bacterium]
MRTYNAIVENPYATNNKLSVLLDLSERTIREHINSLKNEKLIVRQGAKKNGYWEVVSHNIPDDDTTS